MATEVKLPRLGQGMESGTIVRWLKSEGEVVKKREPLYELDTDKVTQEVEAEADGVLLKILVDEGEVDVGTTVAVIGNEGEEITVEPVAVKAPTPPDAPPPDAPDGAADASADATSDTEPGASAPAAPSDTEPGASASAAPAAASTAAASIPAASTAVDGGKVKASPLARRIARERGIELASVSPTGPEGRIVAEDVERAEAAGPPAATTEAAPAGPPAATTEAVPAGEVEVVQLTSVRKTIARRLTEAWSAPVFQLGVSADMTEALHLREQLVSRLAEG